MDLLRRFNGDTATKEELLNFIYAHINTTALERMYEGNDVSHIKDAKVLIDSAFNSLEEMYGIKIESNVPTNQAR